MQQEIKKTNFGKSKVSKIIASILQDAQMTSEFVIDNSQDNSDIFSKTPILKVIEKLLPIKQESEKQEPKNNTSRLEIQIQKYGFNLSPYSGEVFLLLFDAFLQGKSNEQNGKFMLTNFRVLFFKDAVKRVDLPFGLISKVQYSEKQMRVAYTLKYPHFWKFLISSPSKFQQLKNFGEIFYKSNQIKKNFAYQYALKITQLPSTYEFKLIDQYNKLRFTSKNNHIQIIAQPKYELCLSYPSQFISVSSIDLNTASNHRKNKRFPILAYKYTSHSQIEVPLWITSSYEDIKLINKSVQKDLLNHMKCGLKMQIFVAQSKTNKTIDQQMFDKQCSITYLKLQSNDEVKNAQMHLFEVFLFNKKPFIKQILNSKWYNYIGSLLSACQSIRNAYLRQSAILIKCEGGRDKSLILSSLLQIIMDPYYRTFKGFESLVMRMFIHNGHSFADRLGLRKDTSELCPIFLQFLDCVSQLINQNPSSFQFNFKYLAKISNLMQINIYGTFLANCSKEYCENRIEIQTCSIWSDIINPITQNGFYNKFGGILDICSQLSSIRIWKEHFGDMISRSKDHYRMDELAEDNQDYINLYSLRLRDYNQQLMAKMKEKIMLIEQISKNIKEQSNKN